jgi:hypothetical protein
LNQEPSFQQLFLNDVDQVDVLYTVLCVFYSQGHRYADREDQNSDDAYRSYRRVRLFEELVIRQKSLENRNYKIEEGKDDV